MVTAQLNAAQPLTMRVGLVASDIEALQGLIDAFVATTLETISSADATCPRLYSDPEHRARVNEILSRLGEVEALMGIIRKLSED